ncbi:caspase domain-containing protein [Armillaria luteobubalina]|uniref:Caspase domain-containing protein n=1 Tax=Armillaria luteobubalina TaxID=153913 RepID=A0AA39PQ04_9AGAR|nr:caspase domain-containing protein [Armillaria luteobubalina]
MKAFTHDAQPRDRFFFYYSGHSTQQQNESGTEEDGQDECLVTKSGSCIRDNDLRRYLVDPLPAGCQLTAVLDTCHSGSLLDLPHYRCNRVFGRRRSESWWKILTNESDVPSTPENDTSNAQRDIELQALLDRFDTIEEESDTDVDSDERVFKGRDKMCLSPIQTDTVPDFVKSPASLQKEQPWCAFLHARIVRQLWKLKAKDIR